MPGCAVPRRSAELEGRAPRDFVAPGGSYPNGPWVEGTPVLVRYVASIVDAVANGMRDRRWSVLRASEELGVARQTMHDILSGRTVPDLLSIVRAEQALGRSVWPGRALAKQFREGRHRE